MFKFILKKISQKIIKKQIRNESNLFARINNNNDKLVFLDIGGAGGLNRRWRSFEKFIRPIFVEPDKRSYLELMNNGFEVITKGLWSQKTQKKFYLTKKLHCSSIYKPNYEYLNLFPNSSRYKVTKTIELDLEKLDDQINLSNQPHFIKLDIQGAELEVLKGGSATISKVLGLEIEINFKEIYKGIPLAKDVEFFLEKEGFFLNDFLTLFRWERDLLRDFGELIHGDALYLRTPEKIIEMSKEVSDPTSLFANYIRILFVYNKLDLIIKLSEYISVEQRKILNLDQTIVFLQKKYKNIARVNNYLDYFVRYFISKDLELPHWKL